MVGQESVRSGPVAVRKPRRLIRDAWNARELILVQDTLAIQRRSSTRRRTIHLKDVTELERTDLTPYCLLLKAAGKSYYLSFQNDSELYDWQDDIYNRCPRFGSLPYNFVHEAHVGYDSDLNSLPLQYTEALRGKAKPPLDSASVDYDLNYADEKRPLASTSTSMAPQPKVILEGQFSFKQEGAISGLFWKSKWITLTSQALAIHRSQSSGIETQIPLSGVTAVERVDVRKPYCLLVVTQDGGKYLFSFNSDSELYAWHDAIYQRHCSSGRQIGAPTNFVHNVHVGVDGSTGDFTGLPSGWERTMYPSRDRAAGGPRANTIDLKKAARRAPSVNSADTLIES
ncbi:hypothetical protein BDQ12DRAFT_723110 [Crucibulum laeve]|uniref:non-specific serine/threonine protein kinase n=1 Tax=Crucibulum laeve TaxID=68775 RepID=A0A5C3M1W5_9AGAR|nr:hypothetical protein BDQ12DRAFT_723110 [Crucibulum laeve]